MRTMWIITGVWVAAIVVTFAAGWIALQLPLAMEYSGLIWGLLMLNAGLWPVLVLGVAVLVTGWPTALISRARRPRPLPSLPLFQLPGLPGWYRVDEKTGHYMKVPPQC